jgi:transcriptional regulator with XRE-family HTH domain
MANAKKVPTRRPARLQIARAKKTEPVSTDGRQRLDKFGEYLHSLRVNNDVGMSQAEMAKELRKNGYGSATQSLIAQLETGRITNPSKELLEHLANAYKAPSYDALVMTLVCDKYGISGAKAELLKRDIRDIKGLAEWECEVKPEELWIVAPNFVDDEDSEIQEAVFENLKRPDCTFTYFVDQSDVSPDRRFGRLLLTFFNMADDLGLKGRVRWFGFEPMELRVMGASYVISNPGTIYKPAGDKRPEGFMVISSDKNRPQWGIKMEPEVVLRRISNLNGWMAKKRTARLTKAEEDLAQIIPEQVVRNRELKFSNKEVQKSS